MLIQYPIHKGIKVFGHAETLDLNNLTSCIKKIHQILTLQFEKETKPIYVSY